MTTPASLPVVAPTPEQQERQKRIYATMRWAGVIAVTEMRDGFDAAMEIVSDGPERFMPDEHDMERINSTAVTAITFIETGRTGG